MTEPTRLEVRQPPPANRISSFRRPFSFTGNESDAPLDVGYLVEKPQQVLYAPSTAITSPGLMNRRGTVQKDVKYF